MKVKLIEVVLDRLAYGWSPEEIHFQHPGLALAQIYAALTYYYDNQANLDREIARQQDEVRRLRDQAGESPLFVRLEASKPSGLLREHRPVYGCSRASRNHGWSPAPACD